MKNCVFLSYQHESIHAICQLADELRFRGIIPWVDKLPGGFRAGDPSEFEARRVIREDSTMFVLYLTKRALSSGFIRDIEIPEARLRQAWQRDYPIVVVSPEYRFGQLKSLTKQHFGIDLTPANGYAKNHGESLDDFLARVSRHLLHRHVCDMPAEADQLSISVNTYERLPMTDEVLFVDATTALELDVTRAEVWERLLVGLQDAKCELSARFGRPRLKVNGSKHLTAAFATGRVFNQYELNIRQRDDYWSTDAPCEAVSAFAVQYRPGAFTAHSLTVEVATGDKDVAGGVDRIIEAGQLSPGGRLGIRPVQGRVNMDAPLSRTLAQTAYSKLDEVTNLKPTNEVHVFIAAPQAFTMMLGTLFQGMPEVHFYEWTPIGYAKSLVIPTRLR